MRKQISCQHIERINVAHAARKTATDIYLDSDAAMG